MTQDQSKKLAIKEVIENWVIWRDAGLWDRFPECWHEEGMMIATWFQDHWTKFVETNKQGFDKGLNILHMLGANSIDLAGNRAISQTKTTVLQRAPIHDILCDVTCQGRHYDYFEKRDGRWAIVLRQSIFEKDWVTTVEPGGTIPFNKDLLAEFPEGYRHLGYLQSKIGYNVSRKIPGIKGPEVEEVYRRGAQWLSGETDKPEPYF